MNHELRSALNAIVAYNWSDELTDYIAYRPCDMHIFHSLVEIDNYLEDTEFTADYWADLEEKGNIMTDSTLTKKQEKTFGPVRHDGGILTATVRFDDPYGNGYNTFSITGRHYIARKHPYEDSLEYQGRKYYLDSCGCLHEEISKAFPRLSEFIKWHLCSTDGPLYYVANTVYWAEQGNLNHARSSAIWPEASLEQLKDKELLLERLPSLMKRFRLAMEELGFV